MKTLFCILICISGSALAQSEGSKGGNGGGVEFCPDRELPGLRAQAYDLAEYRGDWGVSLLVSRLKMNIPLWDHITTKDQYLERALQKVNAVNPGLALAIQSTLETFSKKVTGNGNPEFVNDANALSNGKGCRYVQLVNWLDDPEVIRQLGLPEQSEKADGPNEYILRDDTLYKSMDPLDQAANDFHEAVYKVKRRFKRIDPKSGSTFIRRFVATAFSTDHEISAEIMSHISYLGTPQLVYCEPNGSICYDEAESHERSATASFFSYGRYYFPDQCSESELARGTVSYKNKGTLPLKYQESRGVVFYKTLSLAPNESVQRAFERPSEPTVQNGSAPYLAYNFCYTKNDESPHVIMAEITACGKSASFELPINDCKYSAYIHTIAILPNPFLKR